MRADETPGFAPELVIDRRYRLVRPLARGGMGAVWIARQITLDREVAIKALHKADATAGARLEREARALAAIRHPSVVQVFDYGTTEAGVPYLVMELVHGEALDDRLDRAGPLSAADAVSIVVPLLDGLAAAHARGIVHRDVKPSNVVLSDDGGVPKLLDFGIARAEVDARLTSDGRALGTPDYMSPEQVLGGTIDARTDVWGAGVLLYELVSGELPFAGSDLMGVLKRVLESPPSFPRGARGLDGPLWKILTAAIRKRPNERTASARVMRDQLVAWLANTSGVSAAPPAREPPAESREMETASLPITPSIGVGIVGALSYEDPADHASMDALVKKKLGG